MKFPGIGSKSNNSKNEPEKQVLAIQIGSTQSATALFSYTNNQISIKELVNGKAPHEALESLLGKSKGNLPVLFGIPDFYIRNNEITTAYKEELKILSQEFGLTPIGFVSLPEALAHHLEQERETPQTALFVGMTKKILSVSLYRIGKNKNTTHVTRTGNLFSDFETALQAFHEEEILPSRLVLYNENPERDDDLKEKFLTYPWQQNEKFLHVPKIETTDWKTMITAVVFAGASELDEESIAQARVKTASAATVATSNAQDGQEDEYMPDEKVHDLEDAQQEDNEELELLDTDKDIEDISKHEKTEAEALGFTHEEEDVMTKHVPEMDEENDQLSEPVINKPMIHSSNSADDFPRSTTVQPSTSVTAEIPSQKPKKRLSLPSIPKLPMPRNMQLPKPKGMLLVAGGVVVLLIALFGYAVYAYPQSTVTFIANPEVIEDELTITLNTNTSEVDVENGEIPGKIYSTSVSGSKSTKATGEKQVGEPATGEVIVYNKTTDSQSIPAGTVLGASDGVEFTLDDDVQVASASDTGTSLEYGKSSVAVTAKTIGKKGNISGGTEMSVGDKSSGSIIAKNDDDFSGGTEKTVTVVSSSDHESLLEDLIKELSDQAKQQLQLQLSGAEKFLEESLTENVVFETYNADIEEEADNVELSLELEFAQTGYSQEDIDKYFEEYAKEELKEGFTLDKENSYFNVKEIERDDNDTVTFTADYFVYLVPDINLDELKGEVQGASEKDVEKVVESLIDKNIIGYEITHNRALPFLNFLPFNPNNISVELETY